LVGVLLGALGQRSFGTNATKGTDPSAVVDGNPAVAQSLAPSAANSEPRQLPAASPRRGRLALAEPDDDDDDGVQTYRAKQSNELLELVLRRLRLAEKGVLDRTPESVANQLSLYQAGMTDALTRLAPELAPHLSASFEKAMCDPRTDAATLITMARMTRQMPDLASRKGFDCLLASHRGEDMVLWSALDAMAAAQLPLGPAASQLARTARDERTLRRVAAVERGASLAARESEQGDLWSEEKEMIDEN
jgi:hypothetical protein